MADTHIYLSFEGVKGESTLSGTHVTPGPGNDWAGLFACRFSADANVQSRAMSKGASTRVDFGGAAPPIEIRKPTDAATAGLLREALSGKTPRKAVIVFVRTDVDAPTEYLRYELEACHVVSFDVSGSSADARPVETYMLRYGRLTIIAFAGGHGAKGARSSAVMTNGA